MKASRRLEILAGTPPGGGQDRAARALTAAIAATSDLEVTVSNVVGRGGGAAWEAVASRPGDRGVLSISSPTLISNHLHDPTEPGQADLTHVAMLCTEPLVFAVASHSYIARPEDLLTAIAGGSMRVSVATALGNVNHIAVAEVAAHIGADPRSMPVSAFASAGEAVADLGVHHDLAVVSAASALDAIVAGRVRAVAVSAPARAPGALADTPLWTESGVPVSRSTWRGVLAPSGLAEGDRRELERMLSEATAARPWQDAVMRHVWVPMFLLGPDVDGFIAAETRSMRDSLERTGMLDG